jgi:UDPglucose--hexose-1-phosphate uridylyltransferase
VPEIRVDPLTGNRAIIAAERADRPGGIPHATPAAPIDPESDPFAEGHEDRTPPELYAVRPNGGPPNSPGWQVRVVPNLYPALAEADGSSERDAYPDLFFTEPASGAHEVIVNAPTPVVSLGSLTVEQVVLAADAWRERMRAHPQAAYIHLIVNERVEAGASLPHTHAQLYALDFVPAGVARERERFAAYAVRTMGSNLLGDLVAEEVRRGERIVAIDDEAVLMAPFGSRLPFQLMVAPRRPRDRFEDDGPTGAALLHEALQRLARRLGSTPPLNLWVRTAPRGADHF